ncbi:hypothetical protein [Streptomyces sp. NBC_00019]|uniref:hypothetical protein n=1 Tax=Streptomyces sp. NBC_00019 TaxID=2975623 RepID=UPI00324909DD
MAQPAFGQGGDENHCDGASDEAEELPVGGESADHGRVACARIVFFGERGTHGVAVALTPGSLPGEEPACEHVEDNVPRKIHNSVAMPGSGRASVMGTAFAGLKGVDGSAFAPASTAAPRRPERTPQTGPEVCLCGPMPLYSEDKGMTMDTNPAATRSIGSPTQASS